MKKTKWQLLVESEKGHKEYNPYQSFSLNVKWIVRSKKAAQEMIEKGFEPCSKCTQKDTPTTITYIFRISQNQSLATKFKNEIKTIRQHPHYFSAFKSIDMGIPKPAIEHKLMQGGINLAPLSWDPETLIEEHKEELDFDPVVLECTEIYLDNRSFYEHIASNEWMKASAEINKPSRSLKPITYCIGSPSDNIWQKAIEPSLKAIRFNDDNREQIKDIQPILNIEKFEEHIVAQKVFFIEIDATIENDKILSFRSCIPKIQNELKSPIGLIFPTNADDESPIEELEVRIIFSFPYYNDTKSNELSVLVRESSNMQGRIIVFDEKCWKDENNINYIQQSEEENIGDAKRFLQQCELDDQRFVLMDARTAKQEKILAGYPLHPLFMELIADKSFNYEP